jgi:hypothetical protein
MMLGQLLLYFCGSLRNKEVKHMSSTQLWILALVALVCGAALAVFGGLTGNYVLMTAGIGMVTSVLTWVGLPRPADAGPSPPATDTPSTP